MKKVLILHQHFKTPQSGGAIRSYYLAKALVEQGIRVVVITAHSESSTRVENVEGIEVHYLPVAYDNRFGFSERSRAFLKFISQSTRLAGTIPDVDVCYAISVPLTIGIAALRIKLRYKVPYIFEVGDLWPDAPIQMGFIKNVFFKQSLYRLEKIIYKGARSIVALSPMIQSTVQSRVSKKQVHLIPNMADTEFFKPSVKNPDIEEKFGVRNKFVISYIGAIGLANRLEYFLECALACQMEDLPVHFLLCGDGATLEELKKIHGQLNLRNFTFIPFQNRDGVSEVMNVTDATFICYKPIPILETGSPNKYFDGLAAGKLIIINFKGWIKDEIEQHQCGFYIDPMQPIDLVEKIKRYLDKDHLLSAQQASRSLAESLYSRKKLSERFVSLFK
ncbi:MAG TPA: glycosyltransferase family 4 protein [Ohtaekwangia sp.]